MRIAVPKEIKPQEQRVALLPSAAYQLVRRGHEVIVERNAGADAGFLDDDYRQAGATVRDDHAAVFVDAELIVNLSGGLQPHNCRSSVRYWIASET